MNEEKEVIELRFHDWGVCEEVSARSLLVHFGDHGKVAEINLIFCKRYIFYFVLIPFGILVYKLFVFVFVLSFTVLTIYLLV